MGFNDQESFPLITSKIKGLISSNKLQFRVYTGISVGVLGFSAALYFSNNQIFQRFLGNLNPLLAFLFISIIGGILLSILISYGWFAIYKKVNLQSRLLSIGLAAIFGVIIILMDLKIKFPVDMNVLFPESLLFYPAIGFFVEILFHVLPLSILLISLTSIIKTAKLQNITWICILIVALIEPVYQTIDMGSSNQYPLWAVGFVGLHVFLINLFQLIIFKRFDFVSMFSFRLVYYLFWHIGWGYFRLRLLF